MSKISKYDVLSLLAKKMVFYAATQWLKKPNNLLCGAVPSDLMKEGKVEEVYAALQQEISENE